MVAFGVAGVGPIKGSAVALVAKPHTEPIKKATNKSAALPARP
jgi:hypothetical protein